MKRQSEPTEPTKIEIETFRPLMRWGLNDLTQAVPSCWNGEVRVKRWRITVEEIVDPPEVLAERILTMLREETNHRRRTALLSEASRLGIDVKGAT